jgi:hypothetical protein
MVLVNAVRYGYGLDGYGLPVTLSNPGLSYTRLGISAAVAALLLLVSGYLLLQASRTRRDLSGEGQPAGLPLPSYEAS